MSRNSLPQVNYRPDPEIMNRVREQAKKLRLTYSDALDAAAKFWLDWIKEYGDEPWKP